VTLGSSHDGTPYVVGLHSADDELIAVAGRSFEDVVALVTARGGALGMLRSERRLSSPADAAALAVDPLAPPELARELAPLARRLRARAHGG
jgi:hypothetical protein